MEALKSKEDGCGSTKIDAERMKHHMSWTLWLRSLECSPASREQYYWRSLNIILTITNIVPLGAKLQMEQEEEVCERRLRF